MRSFLVGAGLAVAVWFGGELFVRAAHASERQIATVSGAWVQTFTGTAAMGGPNGLKVVFQCPGQAVYYRPSSATTTSGSYDAYADAGPGDQVVDFNAQPRAFTEQLNVDEDRIYFRNYDGGSVSCAIARVKPAK